MINAGLDQILRRMKQVFALTADMFGNDGLGIQNRIIHNGLVRISGWGCIIIRNGQCSGII